MAQINFNDEGLITEPCCSCNKAYIEDIWNEWCCDEKECIYNTTTDEKIEYNIQFKKQSVVTALRDTLYKYKQAVAESLRYIYITDDGTFAILKGQEERNNKVKELEAEMQRLQSIIYEINRKEGNNNGS